jgi:hypothetical protein
MGSQKAQKVKAPAKNTKRRFLRYSVRVLIRATKMNAARRDLIIDFQFVDNSVQN